MNATRTPRTPYVLIEYEPGDEIAGPGWWIGKSDKPGSICCGGGPTELGYVVTVAATRWPDLDIVVLRRPHG